MNIESLCDKVLPGCSMRADCPSCGGKNTFSVSKHNGYVMWRCFKASCNLKPGKKFVKLGRDAILDKIASRIALGSPTEAKRPFTLPDYWVQGIASKKCFQMLLTTNSIESYLAGYFRVAYDPRQDRLVYLVQDSKGDVVGGVGRAMSGQLPKVHNYPGSSGIPFTCGTGKTAVLVEDCASACSIGRFPDYTGIALLGTEIKEEYFSFVIFNYTNIVIALDKDAMHKAIKLRKKFNIYIDNIKLWKLYKDLKDLTKEQIYNLIKLE